jgi:DNA-binding transcriptional ArsR family regulator
MVQATLTKTDETMIDGCCGPVAVPTIGEQEAEEYAGWFKALADPTRVRILNLLARNDGPLCVCDIVDQFDLGQPTISHHLKILKETCFVHAERRGTFMYYQINRNCLQAFPEAASHIMGQ